MAQHQHILCSSSGRSKSGKPKKIPQRGLGVAQLEKIRIEEQRRKMQSIEEASKTFGNNTNNMFVSSTNESSNSSHCFSGPNLPRSFSGANWGCNFIGEEHRGYAVWPQNHANVSSMSSSSSPQIAHVLNSHIEPPSNQSPCGSNNYAFAPSQHQQNEPDDRCKMVGVKRPYPFPLDNSSMQLPFSSTGHFHTVVYSDQSYSKDPRIKQTRESPLNSSTLPRDSIEHNGKLRGDFLTLAPPTVVLPDSDQVDKVVNEEENEGRQCFEEGSNRAGVVMRLSQSRNEDRTKGKGEGSIDLDLKL